MPGPSDKAIISILFIVMIVNEIPTHALSFFIAITKDSKIASARLKFLSKSDFKRGNSVLEPYILDSKETDEDFEAFVLFHLHNYLYGDSDLWILRYDFPDKALLPPTGKQNLISYIQNKLLPYIQENNIKPSRETSLWWKKITEEFKIETSRSAEIDNMKPSQIESLIQKYQNDSDAIDDILQRILDHFVAYLYDSSTNNELYRQIVYEVSRTSYYRLHEANRTPVDVFPDEGHPLQFFKYLYPEKEFQRLYKLYKFQSERESRKILYIDLNDIQLTEKQIAWISWNLERRDPNIFLSVFKQTNYYREYLKNDFITDFVSPFYLLVAAQKIRQADRYSEIASLETRPLEKRLLINEATYLRESGWLDCIAIKTELLKSYPFNKMDFPSNLDNLKMDIAECTLLGIPFLDELKRNFSELNSRLHSKDIIPVLKTEFNSDNHQIRIDNEHTSECHLINIGKKYHLNGDTVLTPPKFFSNVLEEKEISYMSLGKILNGYQNLFEYRKPSFRTSIQLKTIVTEDNLDVFIKDYMTEMGYRNVPYFAFKFQDKNQTLIEIVGENFVEINGQCHAVCSVLNHYKAPLIFNELLKKYQLTPLSKINKYLSGEDPENPSIKNNPKLKI